MRKDLDVVIIKVNGVTEKVDLTQTLLTKSITPAAINAKLGAAPYMYSRIKAIKTDLEKIIAEKEDNLDRWMVDKMTFVTDDKKVSESARIREVKQKFSKEYYAFRDELRDLIYYRDQAKNVAKGLETQSFTLGDQVKLIQGQKAVPDTFKEIDGLDNVTKEKSKNSKRRK